MLARAQASVKTVARRHSSSSASNYLAPMSSPGTARQRNKRRIKQHKAISSPQPLTQFCDSYTLHSISLVADVTRNGFATKTRRARMVIITRGETLAASSPGFVERGVPPGEFVPDARQLHALLSQNKDNRNNAAQTLINSTFPVGNVWPVTSST